MATMAATANEIEIKVAMNELGIGHWTDELLDEIELNRRLKISLEQDEKGEIRPADKIIDEISAELKNGFYDRR
jgi:hypothetical protein